MHKILRIMVYVSLEVTKTAKASSFKNIKDIYRSFTNILSLYFFRQFLSRKFIWGEKVSFKHLIKFLFTEALIHDASNSARAYEASHEVSI